MSGKGAICHLSQKVVRLWSGEKLVPLGVGVKFSEDATGKRFLV